MSKMPAKKKSCFQITSVTQAQVAASSNAADDTESLDDPDDSRAEDVSSEIFDVVTRASDYEQAACGDRSSSEEALTFNNAVATVGPEPPETAHTHIPLVGQLSSGNPNGTFRIVAVQGPAQPQAPGAQIAQPGAMQPQPAMTAGGGGGPTGVSAITSQPVPAATGSSTQSSTTTAASSSTTVSCSSRFRVIKLDHGTGEPFRRGRWTCTEFYEKDSDGSIVSRTVDSIRHASTTSTVDPGVDRDSGLGQTGGSVVVPLATYSGHSGVGSIADASSLSASRMPSVDALQQQQQQQHQNYSVVKPGGSAAAAQNAFSSSKPTAVLAQQQQQPAVVGLQPSNAQTLLPVGHNGLPQVGAHLQKSPGMPPAGQPVSYPPQQQMLQQQQQVPATHHLTGQSPSLLMNQTEYYQQPQPAVQTPAVTGLSAGPHPGGQGLSQVMAPATSMQSQEMAGASVGSMPPGSQAASGLLLQQIGGGMLGVGGSAGQYVASGQPHGLHTAPSGVQNVPVVGVASAGGVPTTVPAAVSSASSAVMPILTSSPLPVGQQSLMPPSNMLAPGGGLAGQGLPPAAGFAPGDAGSGRRLDGLASPQPPIAYGKDLMKPLIPESLQLATPTVNSLFGNLSIPVDGDEDSASGTSVVAIDNKIEQAMDLVKSHLMYAVREEVEVLKEQIKELFERNSMLERENAVLKSLANSEQLSQLQSSSSSSSSSAPGIGPAAPSASAAGTPPQQQQQQQGLNLQAMQITHTTQAPVQPPQAQPQPHHHHQDPNNGQQLAPPPPQQQQQQPSVTSA